MLRNKEFKANIYSFKDLTKLKNKLKYFKSKRNIKANTSQLDLSYIYCLSQASKSRVSKGFLVKGIQV